MKDGTGKSTCVRSVLYFEQKRNMFEKNGGNALDRSHDGKVWAQLLCDLGSLGHLVHLHACIFVSANIAPVIDLSLQLQYTKRRKPSATVYSTTATTA